MDGLQITSIIRNLADQATKQGGQVDFLCGNHEMDFIIFLCKAGGDRHAVKNANFFTTQDMGIWELAQFDTDPDSELKKINPLIRTGKKRGSVKEEFENNENELWPRLYDKMPEILANMRNNPEGRKILENICQIKVAVVYDDTLFCHTDPTIRMIADLARDGNIVQRVLEINNIFQENLRRVLFQGEKWNDDFEKVMEIYLNARNRNYFVEQGAFNNITENLLVKILEHLYEKKKIKFDQYAEKKFEEDGYEGKKWEDWNPYIFRHFEAIDVDESIIANDVETWKIENGIEGAYADEVALILSKLNKLQEVFNDNKKWHAEFDKMTMQIGAIAERIEKLNPVGNNIKKVKDLNINAIIHGHTPNRENEKNEQYYDENDLIIVSPHVYFDKGSSAKKGISVIRKNGKISLIGKNFRK
jgi:hypothetical protein